jgi:hypothetical protein
MMCIGSVGDEQNVFASIAPVRVNVVDVLLVAC